MKIRSLFTAMLAAAFVISACDKPAPNDGPNKPLTPRPDLHIVEFPFNEDYPLEVGSLVAEGSDNGVTIEVTHIEDNNFVFELRPGPSVQSFKLDVYPLANLYNTLLNSKNSGKLTTGDPVAVNEIIREYLFVDGSGGYAFSVLDYENPEDFLQLEYDWMSTPYAAASAIAIPDCGFVIAVVASPDTDISSANQSELTLCYVHTTSKPLVGDPQVEIEITTGYRAFGVMHHLNSDAAGIYYFGGLASEVDEYIDTFGDVMFRDFLRTLYSSPVTADNEESLYYSKDYGQTADHNLKSTACAVAVDANLTPQKDFARQDFTLDEMPPEEEQELAEPKIIPVLDRIGASYVEYDVIIPKVCNTIFYSYYTEEEKLSWDNASSLNRKKEAIRLFNEGYGHHNPNFSWNEGAPEGEEATGKSATVRISDIGFEPGTTIYVGMTGRNGYGTPGPLLFSDPIKLDERNYTSPDNCTVEGLGVTLDNPTRTSFRHNITYVPSTVSVIHTQYIPEKIPEDPDEKVWVYKPWQEVLGLDVDSPWSEWIDFIFNPAHPKAKLAQMLNMNHWEADGDGLDQWTWTGMEPGIEYTMFVCAEDFDGNISPMYFDSILTKEPQIGPDPTVNMELRSGEGGYSVVYTIDHDVEYFKYATTVNVADLGIPGANTGSLNNIAASGIPYETWRDAIYEWITVQGMDTNYESVSQEVAGSGTTIAACLGVGKDADGNPVYKMNHLIIKDGKAQTLEEIFGI